MQSLETIKAKSQKSINRLVDLGKSQPAEVQTWGVTGGAALAGALAVAAVAKGILAVVVTIANPPVALAVGAVAGGAVGWTLMQQPTAASAPTADTAPAAAPTTENDAPPDTLLNQEAAMRAA